MDTMTCTLENEMVNVKEKEIEIPSLDILLNILEGNASDEEKHNFVINHGFVSVQHCSFYVTYRKEADILKSNLDDLQHTLSPYEISIAKKEISGIEILVNRFRNVSFYKDLMRITGREDISPYGENILKREDD